MKNPDFWKEHYVVDTDASAIERSTPLGGFASDGKTTVSLFEPAALNVSRAGSKAANLARLLQAGFPVPDGFVVTVDAFEHFLAVNGFSPDTSYEAVATASVPEDIADALRTALARLGDAPLAVRSSGVAEDLPGASFAGQYETVLGVRGGPALLAAVRHCWASAFGERVAAYRAARTQKGVVKMAVLVQRLVPADAAGVAFTANPVTGSRSETVISAVRGLGDRLVSGQVSPDEWLIEDDKVSCPRNIEGAIDAAEAKAVADLARRVETYLGNPQDIEWAIADGQLFLLQARPITALPEGEQELIPVPAKPPSGFWERESSHYPEPLSPMHRSIFLPVFNAALKRAVDEASLLVETVEHREIGGWIYQRMVPLGGKDRKPPPAWLMPLLIRIVPQLRSRIKGSVETIRSGKIGAHIEQWYTKWKPGLIASLAKFRDIALSQLSDDALDQHLTAVIAFVNESINIHALLNGAVILSLAEIAFACRELFGWDEQKTFELFNGLSEKSSEPSRRLAQLAQMARERPILLALLERTDDDTVNRLADVDQEFADSFKDYQQEFGCRALRSEIAYPTLAEKPALILSLIRDQIVRGYDPIRDAWDLEQKRIAAVAEARAALASRSSQDRERFEQALIRGEGAYPIREDNQFYTVSASIALMRYAVLELGRRLTERNQIASLDDVFFLELEEARTALRDDDDQHALVRRRKAERAWVEAHPGPTSYGKAPGQPPSLAPLPAETRFLTEAFLWAFEHVQGHGQHRPQEGTRTTTVLHGLAASPGRYTGSVRIIMNESEFSRLQPGDILVCPTTSPVWSVLFPSVGALVTDSGGILSHPAIIAREYRVPAVVATGNATSVLHDGQKITVDGGTGVIDAQQ